MKCKKKLEEVGLLVKHQKKIRGAQMSNSYEITYDLSAFTLVFPEGMRKIKLNFYCRMFLKKKMQVVVLDSQKKICHSKLDITNST